MIKTYEDAEKFLEQHPDHKDIMQATLVVFETGYTQAINDMLKMSKDKDVTMKQFARLLQKSVKRAELLYAGNMRPDLEPECTI